MTEELPWDLGWIETPTTAKSPSPPPSSDSSALVTTSSSAESHQEKADRLLSLIRIGGTPLRAAIDEPMHPQARMLFSHFCDHIAPMMVVLDFAGNGYRDIILPLAMQDDVLRRAVSVVAAFHLAQKAPQLRQAAIAGHQAIVEKLRRDSLLLGPGQLFTPYTWATIVVLLVGETITGADNYVYLLEMLTCLRQSPEAIETLPSSLREFFLQQVKMFELFGFPLSNEAKGLDVIRRNPDAYMDFMMYPTLSSASPHHANMQLMRGAIRDACDMYQRRAMTAPPSEDSAISVELLRRRVLPLDAHTPGAHALVWTYFVAAAESSLPEHREFFTTRLCELHNVTGFGSIPAALRALETIWAMQGVRRWTEIMSKDMPVLVM
ncbi:hypothetical protein F5X68DRAFT_171425 [Plectosphaerella plurivora]|uniref:Uncharacterized protein n=1 Tax=Plectosphaerella plurivora TaxID=936078 RepID=A0A9P8V8F4_9PEZI|nr:hypothetical protein F5X68DRAFT_171425 [Plectosphaerella plurivora]